MGKYKVKKTIYALVFIVAPVSFLIMSIAWGHFFTSKGLWEVITDNLSVLAMWYMIMSLFWFFNMNYLETQAEKISKEIEKS